MSGLVERLRFALRDWDGKSRIHFPSINALAIDEAVARIAALEAEVGRKDAALEDCAMALDEAANALADGYGQFAGIIRGYGTKARAALEPKP